MRQAVDPLIADLIPKATTPAPVQQGDPDPLIADLIPHEVGPPSPSKGEQQWGPIADQYAQEAGVDPRIYRNLIHQESGWNPHAIGPMTKSGTAKGFAQFVDGTARDMGITDPFDPHQSLRAGARYLRQQLDAFGGDYAKALAAYNAGPGAVQKYGGVPNFPETKDYVNKIMGSLKGQVIQPKRPTVTATTMRPAGLSKAQKRIVSLQRAIDQADAAARYGTPSPKIDYQAAKTELAALRGRVDEGDPRVDALQGLDFDPRQVVASVLSKSATVETHKRNTIREGNDPESLRHRAGQLASQQFAPGQDDDFGIRKPSKATQERSDSPFVRIPTLEATRQIAKRMGRSEKWARNATRPGTAAFKELKALTNSGGAHDASRDDLGAMTRAADVSPHLGAAIVQAPGLGNSTDAGVYGTSFDFSMRPVTGLGRMLTGDLRSPDEIGGLEQTVGTIGDVAAFGGFGAAGEAVSTAAGARAGGSAVLRLLTKEFLSPAGKGLMAKAGHHILKTVVEGGGSQVPIAWGRAADLTRQNGKPFHENLATTLGEAGKGLAEMFDARTITDETKTPAERTMAAISVGGTMATLLGHAVPHLLQIPQGQRARIVGQMVPELAHLPASAFTDSVLHAIRLGADPQAIGKLLGSEMGRAAFDEHRAGLVGAEVIRSDTLGHTPEGGTIEGYYDDPSGNVIVRDDAPGHHLTHELEHRIESDHHLGAQKVRETIGDDNWAKLQEAARAHAEKALRKQGMDPAAAVKQARYWSSDDELSRYLISVYMDEGPNGLVRMGKGEAKIAAMKLSNLFDEKQIGRHGAARFDFDSAAAQGLVEKGYRPLDDAMAKLSGRYQEQLDRQERQNAQDQVPAGQQSVSFDNPGPYAHLKKGDDPLKASREDLEQFRHEDGNLYATVVMGDRAGVHPYIAEDGTMQDQHGGGKYGASHDRYGHVFWASQGATADAQLKEAAGRSKGLSVVTVGAKDQSLSSSGPRRYADEIEAAIRLGKTDHDRVLGTLKEAFGKLGVSEENLASLTVPKALDWLRTKHIPVGKGGEKSFAKSGAIVELLSKKGRSASLGVPPVERIVEKINDADYHGLPTRSAAAFGFMEPGVSGHISQFGGAEHPDYERVIPGVYLGDAHQPMELHRLAKPSFDAWMSEETQAHSNWQGLRDADRATVRSIIDKAKNQREAKAAMGEFARSKGLEGHFRATGEPKQENWYRSLEISKKAVQLDETALQQALSPGDRNGRENAGSTEAGVAGRGRPDAVRAVAEGGASRGREGTGRAAEGPTTQRSVSYDDVPSEQAVGKGVHQAVEKGGGVEEIVARYRKIGLIPHEQLVALVGTKRPEYLDGVVDVIHGQRAKLLAGEITARDIAKGYYMTVASQGASEIFTDTVARKSGVPIEERFTDKNKKGVSTVRPEEAAANWLFTPDGQKALDALERGEFDEAAWRKGADVRLAFGDDRVAKNGVFNEPQRYKDGTPKEYTLRNVDELVRDVNAAAGNPDRIYAVLGRAKGLGPAKVPFMSHMLGFGGRPTLDAVEINVWLTGKGDASQMKGPRADLLRDVRDNLTSKAVKDSFLSDVYDRFEELHGSDLNAEGLPKDVFAHIMHHWIWDAAKGLETTHKGMYEALTQASVSFDTPEFKRFFGESKVVDEQGKPLRVFHGTPTPGFDRFSEGKIGSGFDKENGFGDFGKGFYFTESPDEASYYANPKGDDTKGAVMPLYVKAENPLVIDSEASGQQGHLSRQQEMAFEDGARGMDVWVDMVKRAGFDSVIQYDESGRIAQGVVFDARQVKSALANSGKFDPADRRMDKSVSFDQAHNFGVSRETIADVAANVLNGRRQGPPTQPKEEGATEPLHGPETVAQPSAPVADVTPAAEPETATQKSPKNLPTPKPEPSTTSRIVKVNGESYHLSGPALEAFNAAEAAHQKRLAQIDKNGLNDQERAGARKAAGMQFSKRKREIVGALTAKEARVAKVPTTPMEGTTKVDPNAKVAGADEPTDRSQAAEPPAENLTSFAEQVDGRPGMEGTTPVKEDEAGKAYLAEKGVATLKVAIDRAIAGDGPLRGDEIGAAVNHLAHLNQEIKLAVDAYEKLPEDDLSRIAQASEIDRLEAEAERVRMAGDVTGNEWHKTGQALQVAIRDDFSLASLRSRAKRAMGKADIPQHVSDAISALANRVLEAEGKLKESQRAYDELIKGGAITGSTRAEKTHKRSVANLKRFLGEEAGATVGTGLGGRKAGAVTTTLPTAEKAAMQAARSLAREAIDAGAKDGKAVMDYIRKATGSGVTDERLMYLLSEPYRNHVLELDMAKRDATRKLRQLQQSALEAQKPKVKRAMGVVKDLFTGLARPMEAGMDLSAPFIQGRKGLFVSPGSWLRAWVPMMKALKGGDKAYDAIHVEIKRHPLHAKAVTAGLDFTDPDGAFSAQEEMFAGNLLQAARKAPIPGVKQYFEVLERSNLAYNAFLNRLKMDCFARMAQAAPSDPAYLRDCASTLNTIFGRGASKTAKALGANPTAGALVFAPRYTVSGFEYASLRPVRTAETARGAATAATVYVAQAAAYAGIVGLARMAGWDVEMDPRNVNFGKLRVPSPFGEGDMMVDLFAKEGQAVRLVAQVLYGQENGQGKYTPASFRNTGDVAWKFASGKLSPEPKTMMEAAFGHHDFETNETRALTYADVLGNHYPLGLKSALEGDAYKKAPASVVFNFIGLNADPAKERPTKDGPPLNYLDVGFKPKEKKR